MLSYVARQSIWTDPKRERPRPFTKIIGGLHRCREFHDLRSMWHITDWPFKSVRDPWRYHHDSVANVKGRWPAKWFMCKMSQLRWD